MRTKALILTAVLGVAGIANSLAQVYSVNVVGYANVAVTPGYNLICNPLDNKSGNNLSNIVKLTDNDVGATIFTYTAAGGFASSTYLGTAAGWSPDTVVPPGVGMFLQLADNTTVTSLTFVGDVPQGADSNGQLDKGFTLAGSKVPQSASLAAMSFPAEDGDTIFFYRLTPPATKKDYVSCTSVGGTWIPDAIPGVGEAFWAQKANAAAWTRNFQVQ